jgi:hypothetical protein
MSDELKFDLFYNECILRSEGYFLLKSCDNQKVCSEGYFLIKSCDNQKVHSEGYFLLKFCDNQKVRSEGYFVLKSSDNQNVRSEGYFLLKSCDNQKVGTESIILLSGPIVCINILYLFSYLDEKEISTNSSSFGGRSHTNSLIKFPDN